MLVTSGRMAVVSQNSASSESVGKHRSGNAMHWQKNIPQETAGNIERPEKLDQSK